MPIGLGEDKNPINFGFTGSKFKDKRYNFVKHFTNVYAYYRSKG